MRFWCASQPPECVCLDVMEVAGNDEEVQGVAEVLGREYREPVGPHSRVGCTRAGDDDTEGVRIPVLGE